METLTRSYNSLSQFSRPGWSLRSQIPSTYSRWPRRLHELLAVCRSTTKRYKTFSPIDNESLPHLLNHLNPSPFSYSITPFTDRCTLNLSAGSGGHGCVSFVREKYTPEGPPNGGNGGSGGSIYIQAVKGETSLYRLARTREIRAGNGRNGKGKYRGGERGKDVLLTVPVGTVVREIRRHDPTEAEEHVAEAKKPQQHIARLKDCEGTRKDRLIAYPGAMRQSDFNFGENLTLPRTYKSALNVIQPLSPIILDLDCPTEKPLLLAAGAAGGLGNPHFVTKDFNRPKFATKGGSGLRLTLNLELRILADVGLVGQPNAGKSTLLRSLSNSRTRIGDWAFTTLQPNIGTVMLDNHKGRPSIRSFHKDGQIRTSFTVADIPGLIHGAHMDKGLGLDFLRHVERAAILAFVIDLSAGDAIESLRSLWSEIDQYEILKRKAVRQEGSQHDTKLEGRQTTCSVINRPIWSKPWIVVATKADLPNTENNFLKLKAYITDLNKNKSSVIPGRGWTWNHDIVAIPVSAMNSERVHEIPNLIVNLL